MSILRKPYEIAVYDDILVNDKFQEVRLGIIGSDKMLSQSRAIEPNLVTNVNGYNKFSFKMYKHYTDITTGEKVTNPFVDWLISERKVKLNYDGKWYDFIIKDINESSTDYLYTYQLEDALVQELSKNGFGITLDAESMNNIGNSVELGRQVMAETDWQVDGDVIVEQVDEALVYVTLPSNQSYTKIIDQRLDSNGNYSVGLTYEDAYFNGEKTVLAFYSSCTGKPHRFQFIHCENYNKDENGNFIINRQDDRTIIETDCQGYIDFEIPDDAYYKTPNEFGLYLPKNTKLGIPGKNNQEGFDEKDSQISTWYRGKRYGFAHQSVYIPLLEKYCQKFEKDGEQYLGYTDMKYVSPAVTQNYITGYNFESNAGWTAATSTINLNPPLRENVYGRFVRNSFTTVIDEYFNGSYDSNNKYTPYLKMSFEAGGGNQFVLNSGLKDNRTTIGYITNGEEWVLDTMIIGATGNPVWCSAEIGEYIYDTSEGTYKQNQDNIKFTQISASQYGNNNENKRRVFRVSNSIYTEETFKKNSRLYLKLWPQDAGTYYIKKIALYRKSLDKNGDIIVPDYDSENSAAETWLDTNNLEKKYQYFLASEVDDNNKNKVVDKEALSLDTKTYLNYTEYKPIYNTAGEKIRTVTAKESNYFNILQTIAETFEQWLIINIDRNEDGSIKPNGKKISFKNYRGDNNYACFRYGVNLKNIQRDYSSKNIVSKLIVKQNSNELAENGFCTIARANSNPTGENYIYDFQYYQNTGIMNADEFLRTNYYIDGAAGSDLIESYQPVLYKEEIKTKIEDHYSANNQPTDGKKPYYQYATPKISFSENSLLDSLSRFDDELSTDPENIPELKRTLYTFFIRYDWEVPNYNKYNIEDTGFALQLYTNWYGSPTIKLSEETGEFYGYFTIRASKFYYEDGDVWKKFKTPGIRFFERRNVVNRGWVNMFYDTDQLLYETTDGSDGKEGVLKQKNGIKFSNIDIRLVSITNGIDKNTNSFAIDYYQNETNIQGYFPRLKNLNTRLQPINEEIIGLQSDLVKKKADLKVAEVQKEAASTGIETTREDFRTLTGLNLEASHTGVITAFKTNKVVENSYPNWCSVRTIDDQDDKRITITFEANRKDKIVTPTVNTYNSSIENTYNGFSITRIEKDGGLGITYNYEKDGTYTLTYKLIIDNEQSKKLKNIGWNYLPWSDVSVILTDSNGDIHSWENLGNNYGQFSFEDNPIPPGINYIEFSGKLTEPTQEVKNLYIQPNYGKDVEGTPICTIGDISLVHKQGNTGESSIDRTVYATLETEITLENGEATRQITVEGTLPSGKDRVTIYQNLTPIDQTRSDIQKYIQEHTINTIKLDESNKDIAYLEPIVESLSSAIEEKTIEKNKLLEYKTKLNQMFFERYSRFIQEGTWISEEHVNDEKYYADAQSVLYNSCYPQVIYNINVLELSKLPGYELFTFNLGDKTWVIDDEFFGEGVREEVIITELSENLDDPNKNQIKVQNFKNQFQDLFQKITATVQQTQYNVGSYEKGAALIDASIAQKNEFITSAINDAASILDLAGDQSVVSGDGGITITDKKTPTNQVRIIGGAILLSAEDPKTKEQTWMTGITNKGISANLITAGRLNTGEIQIMSGNDATFKWDAYGLTAYDALWYSDGNVSSISGIDTQKFVRFDKNGIYGINHASGIDGKNWYPTGNNEKEIRKSISDNATFALTWDGLKVTNSKNTTLRIGDAAKYQATENDSTSLFEIRDPGGNTTFAITENGSLIWGAGSTSQRALYAKTQLDTPVGTWGNFDDSNEEGENKWHKVKAPEDYFVSYSADGGNTWADPIQIQGYNGPEPAVCYVSSSIGDMVLETTPNDTEVIFTAVITRNGVELEADNYDWYFGETLQSSKTKQITTTFGAIKNKSVYFIATDN